MMGLQLSPDGEYIDWRAFLLAASQPLPTPTQADLLQALAKFKDMDQKGSGYVTQQQYEKVVMLILFLLAYKDKILSDVVKTSVGSLFRYTFW